MMPKHSLLARRARHVTAFLAVSLLTVAACSDSGGGVAGGNTVVVVEIVPIPNHATLVALIPGNTRQMLGVPTNSADNWVDKPVTWASSNAAVASVDATTGVVTAVAGGSAFIRATAGGRTDSIAVAVRFPVGTVTVAPATVNLRKEGTLQLTTTLLDTQLATVTGRTVVWTSSDTSVAKVSATGMVSASVLNAGTSTITATVANATDGGIAALGTRLVTVAGEAAVATISITGGAGTFYGDTQADIQLTATPLSGLGNTVPGVTITWSSTTPATASVSGTGLVNILAVGTTNIRAQAESFTGSGVTITGTRALNIAATLADGGPVTIPSLAADEDQYYAFEVPAGTDSTVFTMSGGTGDADLYLYRPGSASINFQSFNSGNDERIAVPSTPTGYLGWWRVRVNYWIASGGATLTVTTYP